MSDCRHTEVDEAAIRADQTQRIADWLRERAEKSYLPGFPARQALLSAASLIERGLAK